MAPTASGTSCAVPYQNARVLYSAAEREMLELVRCAVMPVS